MTPRGSTASNPLRQARHREATIIAAGACAVALAAAWSFRPTPTAPHDFPDLSNPPETPAQESAADTLNLAAFQARIWNPRPDPVEHKVAEDKPAAPPPAPLRLQLVAIVRDGEELRAALYDPDANELRLARIGDSVARHTITLVDATGVELRPPGATSGPRRIDLVRPGGAP